MLKARIMIAFNAAMEVKKALIEFMGGRLRLAHVYLNIRKYHG